MDFIGLSSQEAFNWVASDIISDALGVAIEEARRPSPDDSPTNGKVDMDSKTVTIDPSDLKDPTADFNKTANSSQPALEKDTKATRPYEKSWRGKMFDELDDAGSMTFGSGMEGVGDSTLPTNYTIPGGPK